MSDLRPSRIDRGISLVAGVALLGTVLIDAGDVAMRLFGIALVGSTELVQFTVLIATCTALIATTRADRHATVHILVDRLRPRTKRLAGRAGRLMLSLVLLAYVAGTVWLLTDLFGEPERSELLSLPITPLRVVWGLSLFAAAVAALLVRSRRANPAEAADGT